MAGLDNEPLTHCPDRHDGMASCRLCSSTDADAGHEWCAAREGLVCDDCCRLVLCGDIGFVRPPGPSSGLAESAEVIISACLGCERGRRWYTDQLLRSFTHGAGTC